MSNWEEKYIQSYVTGCQKYKCVPSVPEYRGKMCEDLPAYPFNTISAKYCLMPNYNKLAKAANDSESPTKQHRNKCLTCMGVKLKDRIITPCYDSNGKSWLENKCDDPEPNIDSPDVCYEQSYRNKSELYYPNSRGKSHLERYYCKSNRDVKKEQPLTTLTSDIHPKTSTKHCCNCNGIVGRNKIIHRFERTGARSYNAGTSQTNYPQVYQPFYVIVEQNGPVAHPKRQKRHSERAKYLCNECCDCHGEETSSESFYACSPDKRVSDISKEESGTISSTNISTGPPCTSLSSDKSSKVNKKHLNPSHDLLTFNMKKANEYKCDCAERRCAHHCPIELIRKKYKQPDKLKLTSKCKQCDKSLNLTVKMRNKYCQNMADIIVTCPNCLQIKKEKKHPCIQKKQSLTNYEQDFSNILEPEEEIAETEPVVACNASAQTSFHSWTEKSESKFDADLYEGDSELNKSVQTKAMPLMCHGCANELAPTKGIKFTEGNEKAEDEENIQPEIKKEPETSKKSQTPTNSEDISIHALKTGAFSSTLDKIVKEMVDKKK